MCNILLAKVLMFEDQHDQEGIWHMHRFSDLPFFRTRNRLVPRSRIGCSSKGKGPDDPGLWFLQVYTSMAGTPHCRYLTTVTVIVVLSVWPAPVPAMVTV